MDRERRLVGAAQYLRMSTERQDYSIRHQITAIASYAAEHGYEIVKTYQDAGISGLTLAKRAGLSQLISDVVAGNAHFEVVLVYDVSRWGRFQNPDQAAHYEFVCAEAGVRVEYCAEQFHNDGTVAASLLKSLKRVMAAEYSRELSAKVSRAQEALASLGYWQGGPPGYGLRRQQIKADGTLGRVLEAGDTKGPQNGRTILVPGPAEEVAVVRRIFSLYAHRKLGFKAIAHVLDADNIPPPKAAAWNYSSLRSIVTSERYIGNLMRHKKLRRLGGPSTHQPEAAWLRTEQAIEPIISRKLYRAALRRRLQEPRRYTDEEMLEGLRRIYARRGRLNSSIIGADQHTPSVIEYRTRFGSLFAAYDRIGYALTARQALYCALPSRRPGGGRHPTDALTETEFLNELRKVLAAHGRLSEALIETALGRLAYHAGVRRFGGGRRLFCLAGYPPDAKQARVFARSRSQTVTVEEGEILCRAAKASVARSALG